MANGTGRRMAADETALSSAFDYDRVVIFNACKTGKIDCVRTMWLRDGKEYTNKLIHAKTDGTTSLIMASRNGHLEIVEFLVEKCEAEITQPGVVTFDGETIEGAPPLWCAAAAGHLNVVSYLIARGAPVNQTTNTNSTALRAACFDGHQEIVEFLVEHKADIEIANRHGHTCLMIACYKGHKSVVEYLLSLNAEVNRKSAKGNTALHDSAESGCLEIMKLLLAKGALMTEDSYGMTPLLAAAVSGCQNIVSFLTLKHYCDRKQGVEALEVLGATFVDKNRDHIGAIKIWRKALKERKRADLPPLDKPAAEKKVAAYLNTLEVQELEELDTMIHDPDEVRMQSLLIRERVLGPRHPDTSYYIRFRGALYADVGNYERCMSLWMYALEMQRSVMEALASCILSSFLSFTELFAYMYVESDDRLETPEKRNMFAKDILAVLEHGLDELQRYRQELCSGRQVAEDEKSVPNRMLVTLLHLISLIEYLPILNPNQEQSPMSQRFKRLAYRLVKMDVRSTEGATLLHMACNESSNKGIRYPVCSFPSYSVINLLLEVGADPNARDSHTLTPLHMATLPSNYRAPIVQSLVKHGAHLDICSADHVSPITNLHRMKLGCCWPVCPVKHVSLKCLAARTIVHGWHPFDQYRGLVDPDLAAFIELH